MQKDDIIKLAVDSIRVLSMDGVQKANSGHPGAPMALAPVTYVLWKRIMNYNPQDPDWINRDRFILSNGHASMLIYSMLYLTGYDLSLSDLKNFRQMNSKTPGHPEHGITPGVEMTTGPLGQGVMTAVGMAMAEAHLAARFNRPGGKLIDHHTYVICSDGDLMEGASHEAASLAGHLGLGKLIFIYDDNRITIEGDTKLAYSENVEQRFLSYGWHVINIGDSANDLDKIENAINEAKRIGDKPSMVIIRTHIGYGSPNKQGSASAHGSPLGEEEVKKTKDAYGWPSHEPFFVPSGVLDHMKNRKNSNSYEEWNELKRRYESEHAKDWQVLQDSYHQDVPADWAELLPTYQVTDGPVATRAVNGAVLNSIKENLPWLMGGSADLEPSTKTGLKDEPHFSSKNYAGRNIAWGVREMAMCAACSGMALHGGIRPYASTFFVFTDYARAAIRLAALMELPVIYVMTHDSVGLGEDGPTHQPIEHLASLRAMPGLTVIRPADANETVHAWKYAIENKSGPTLLALSRQKLPVIDLVKLGIECHLEKGAYILSPEAGDTPDAIIMATGSEIQVALEAKTQLAGRADVRVVSMPSWELFEMQSQEYRDEILPSSVKRRISIEAGSSMGWHRWVGEEGHILSIDQFGISAPYQEIYESLGLTSDAVVEILETYLS